MRETHLLGPTDDGPETSQAYFFRLEYQDGKRKAATQAYHGSGRVHCHSLNYLREPKRAKLEEKIRATEPSEEEVALRGCAWTAAEGRRGNRLADPGGRILLGRRGADAAVEAHSIRRRGGTQGLLPRHLGDHKVTRTRSSATTAALS